MEEVHAALTFTDANFEEEISKFPGVVLLDFWAPWCQPCRTQGPIVEALATEYAANPKVKIGKLDVDENPATSDHFEIRSIPSLMFFKNGEPVAIKPGLTKAEDLKKWLEQFLADETAAPAAV
jgi:thioredoxin 1